ERVRRLQWWRGLLAATAGAALEKLGDAVGGRSAVRCGTAALDALKPRAGAHRASGEVRASGWWLRLGRRVVVDPARELRDWRGARRGSRAPRQSRNSDRKSTRLNSSHGSNSYAVFCLKKKTKRHQ